MIEKSDYRSEMGYDPLLLDLWNLPLHLTFCRVYINTTDQDIVIVNDHNVKFIVPKNGNLTSSLSRYMINTNRDYNLYGIPQDPNSVVVKRGLYIIDTMITTDPETDASYKKYMIGRDYSQYYQPLPMDYYTPSKKTQIVNRVGKDATARKLLRGGTMIGNTMYTSMHGYVANNGPSSIEDITGHDIIDYFKFEVERWMKTINREMGYFIPVEDLLRYETLYDNNADIVVSLSLREDVIMTHPKFDPQRNRDMDFIESKISGDRVIYVPFRWDRQNLYRSTGMDGKVALVEPSPVMPEHKEGTITVLRQEYRHDLGRNVISKDSISLKDPPDVIEDFFLRHGLSFDPFMAGSIFNKDRLDIVKSRLKKEADDEEFAYKREEREFKREEREYKRQEQQQEREFKREQQERQHKEENSFLNWCAKVAKKVEETVKSYAGIVTAGAVVVTGVISAWSKLFKKKEPTTA